MGLLHKRSKVKILISLILFAITYWWGFFVKYGIPQRFHCTLVTAKIEVKLVLRNANTLKKCLKSGKASWVILIFLPLGILNSCRNFWRSSYLGNFLSFYKACLFSFDLNVLYKCNAASPVFIPRQMPFLPLLFQEQGGYQTDSGMSLSSKQTFPFCPGQSQPTWEPCYRYEVSSGARLSTPSHCWDAEGGTKTVSHH